MQALDHLPPHRRLRGFLEAAASLLEEALSQNAVLGFLPHSALGQLREVSEALTEILERVAHECPHLVPLSETEWGDEDEDVC